MCFLHSCARGFCKQNCLLKSHSANLQYSLSVVMSPLNAFVLLLVFQAPNSVRTSVGNVRFEEQAVVESDIVGQEDNKSCVERRWKHLPSHIVQYSNNYCEAKILRCYCLTPTNTTVVIPSNVRYAVGHCLEGCFITNEYEEFHSVSLKESWNDALCTQFNRVGTLCGKCKSGYGPPAYSFSLRCVQCQNVTLWKQVLFYVAIAYGPLTIFLVIIVVFTISVNSAPLHGWIFVCQIATSSLYMRILTHMGEMKHIDQYSYRIAGTFFGIWNLDFFRSVYKPFCIHPSLTTLQVISLDYIVGVYPLVVIAVTYVFVDLYSRNYRPLVIMWRPFHYCCTRFRHQLNIKTSLIDAFGTFFSLSYIKMLSTIVDLMAPTKVWNDNHQISYHSYTDGTQPYFGSGHAPLVIVSVGVLVVFNLLPLVLLLIYSFPKTQFCINWFPRSLQNAMYPFMDNILSCYKDGTNGTRNCRYFAVVYHISRMLIWSSFMWTESVFSYSVAAVIIIICVLLVTLIRPYKSAAYNSLDTFFLLIVALVLIGNMAYFLTYTDDPQNKTIGLVMAFGPLCIPFLYIFIYMGYDICAVRKLPQILIQKLSSALLSILGRIYLKVTGRERADDTFASLIM